MPAGQARLPAGQKGIHLIVLVTGSHSLTAVERQWAVGAVEHELDNIAEKIGTHRLTLLHGDAWGVDRIAEAYAKRKEWSRVFAFPAQWTRFARGAGMIRNKAMVDFIKFSPDDGMVLAFFPKGVSTPGTANTIQLASQINVPSKILVRAISAEAERKLRASLLEPCDRS